MLPRDPGIDLQHRLMGLAQDINPADGVYIFLDVAPEPDLHDIEPFEGDLMVTFDTFFEEDSDSTYEGFDELLQYPLALTGDEDSGDRFEGWMSTAFTYEWRTQLLNFEGRRSFPGIIEKENDFNKSFFDCH